MNTPTPNPPNEAAQGQAGCLSSSADPPSAAQVNASKPQAVARWGKLLLYARQRDRKWVFMVIPLVLLLAFSPLLMSRARAHHPALAAPATPTVPVATVTREDLFNEVSIAAEFRPFVEVDLHAKVAGYVQDLNVDIGDQVKAGQLLATLEVPELKDELNRALAAQQKAEADYREAHLAYTRLFKVNQQTPNLLAQQDLDAAEAKDRETEAAIAAAKADADKYRTLLAYTRITAPFAGVITHRYADPGALIQAGTSSQTQPLVRLSDNYRLRLDFPVSVKYVKDIQPGDSVEVMVDWLGKSFAGKISRCSQKVDEQTRTMVTEIEVPNPKLELVPGMYATVLLKVQKRAGVVTIPTEAVSSEKTPTVYVVNRGGRVEERTVRLGLETPTRFEVVHGLSPGERVVIGSRSELHSDQSVEPKLVGTLAQQ